MEFLPLMLRKADYDKRGAARYRVLGRLGESVDVDADSAAEALSKSGVAQPTRIVNLELDPDLSAAKPLLVQEKPTVPTSILLDEEKPTFISADMLASESEPDSFVEFSLGALVGLHSGKAPQGKIEEPAEKKLEEYSISDVAASQASAKAKGEATEPETKPSAKAMKAPAAKADAGQAPPAARPEKRELSEDEIARLMSRESN